MRLGKIVVIAILMSLFLLSAAVAGEQMTQDKYEEDQKQIKGALQNMFKDINKDEGPLAPVSDVEPPLNLTPACPGGTCPEGHEYFTSDGDPFCIKCPEGYRHEFYRNEHTCVTNK